MKTYTKAELTQKCKKLFADYDVDVFYGTVDGNVFVSRNYAEMHADKLKSKRIITIEREEDANDSKSTKSVNDVKENVKKETKAKASTSSKNK